MWSTTAEIWMLKDYNVSNVLYDTFGYLCSVELLWRLDSCKNQDLWGLEYSLLFNGTLHWLGSTSNVSGFAIHCSEQSSVFQCASITPACVLGKLKHWLLTTTATNIPFKGPIDELNESCHLLCRHHDQGRDLRTQELQCCYWCNIAYLLISRLLLSQLATKKKEWTTKKFSSQIK